MGKRVLVAVIFIPLLLAAIYGVSPVWPIILPIIIAALSMIAVHEALWSTSFLKHPRISGYSILLAGLIPFWVYYDGRPLPALCGLFVYVLLLFCEAIASRKRITLEKMGGAFFLSVFIPFFLSSFLRIRLMGNWEALVVLPFIVAFIISWRRSSRPKRRWRALWAALLGRWCAACSTARCSSSLSAGR